MRIEGVYRGYDAYKIERKGIKGKGEGTPQDRGKGSRQGEGKTFQEILKNEIDKKV